MKPSGMKPALGLAVVLALALAAGGGYWLGRQGGGEAPATPAAGKQERRILYYRNPMGLPDTSPVPKKDPMGMDYIPVYAGEAGEPAAAGEVRVSPDKVQTLGVKTEAAAPRALERALRAAGRVEPDERRIHAIAPKFEGYVERLIVNATGQPVARGQALFEVYSPELVSAQREYVLAAQGVEALRGAGPEARAGMRQLAEASLARLRNWDISEEQIKALAQTGATRRSLTFRSPVAGIVTDKQAIQGMRFMPGETLYQVADLSRVWVIAEVPEPDIGLIKTGANARLRLDAYPGETFTGRVAYVYPNLSPETRTVPVRIELPNPGLRLKPGMYAQVELATAGRAPVLAVPASAVIDSGVRQVVLVERGAGRYAPREVKLGRRGAEHVEVLEGVSEGDKVVVAANFLIDAESNLKAALGGFGAGGHAPAQPAAPTVGHQAEGRITAIDARAGTVTISHGPVASLDWPAMTMGFKLANPALAQGIKPGTTVGFEFVERAPGEWVITRLEARGGGGGGGGGGGHEH